MAFKPNYLTKIALTNWIHLLGFYLWLEISAIAHLFVNYDSSDNWQSILFGLLLGVPFLMFSYGLLIIVGFLLVIVLLDLILFSIIKNNILLIMVIEWILIIPIFIYWAFKYEYWLWLGLSFTLLITQYIRSKKIGKILFGI
nr:hypothetical protein [Mucilaginibacter sp. X5P1]